MSKLRPPDVKNWLIRKDPDAGKDWRQEVKETPEDEKVGWHHRLDRHGFQQGPGVGDGQGSLMCCSPWGCKEWDMTEQLNWRLLLPSKKKKKSSSISTSAPSIPFSVLPFKELSQEAQTLTISVHHDPLIPIWILLLPVPWNGCHEGQQKSPCH